jgi:phosphoglycerol transferase MdoB-like AlkP superfamily enzyme
MPIVLTHPSVLIDLTSIENLSMYNNVGLSEYSIFGVAALVILLASKKMLKESDRWSQDISSVLEMGILPLIIAFIAILAFNIMRFVGQ